MRRLLLILGLAVIGGCTTITAPLPLVAPTDYSGYFWQTGRTYTYQSATGTHTLTVTGSGSALSISDQLTGGSTSSITASLSNNQFNVSGFSPSDLFGFDNSIQFVSDTSVAVAPPIAVHSIASQGGKLFAASDSYLYEYDIKRDTLLQRSTLPAGMTLYGDEKNGLLYAVEFGGSKLWSSSDRGGSWPNRYVIPGSGITAVTSDNPMDDGDKDLFWVGSGKELFRIAQGAMTPTRDQIYPNPIVALDHFAKRAIVVGLSNGDVDGWNHGGGPGNHTNISGLTCLAGGFAGSGSGVYQIGGPAVPIIPGPVHTLYPSGIGAYGAVASDIWLLQPFPFVTGKIASAPTIQPVSQLALADTDLFALTGRSISYVAPSNPVWKTVNQKAGSAPTPSVGSFTLLSNSTSGSWVAGYIIRTVAGARKVYVDSAHLVSYAPQVVLDSVTYNDVMIFRYTAYAGLRPDVVSIPQYLIYFQRALGAIRIERTLNGATDIFRLVK